MYDSFRGRLLQKTLTNAVIEAGGVGYALEISLRTAERLPAQGSEVFLLAHQKVQEDRHRLFGFIDAVEREAFRELLNVSGVGPSLALSLVSAHEPDQLWGLIRDGQWKALAKSRGIGPKIAQRLCTELKDRARRLATTAGYGTSSRPAEDSSRLHDVAGALLVLGYSDAQAYAAAEAALKKEPANTALADLVRAALQGMQ